MNKLILGIMMLSLLIVFSAPAMGDCSCDVATEPCPCACGTSGCINGTVYTSGGEPATVGYRIYHSDFDDIPDVPDENIKWARLYWHIWMPGDRTVATFCNATGCTNRTINLTDKVNCNQNETEGFYHGGYGTGWVYWNVTDLVTSGANNATVDNDPDGYPAGDGRTFQMYLVVVYEKEGYPQTNYWINQGYMDLDAGQSYTTNFAGAAFNDTNGTLWQLGLAHNGLVNILFNTNLVAGTEGLGSYGLLEEYEIPASWINTAGGNTMKWENVADPHHHPALAIFMDHRPITNITRGGSPMGVPVRKTWLIHQNKYDDYATDFHFKLWVEQDNIDINGWEVDVSDFPVATSKRSNQPTSYHGNLYNKPGIPATSDPDNGMHAIDITADGCQVPYCTWVKVTLTMWITDYNAMVITDIDWTKDSDATQAKPDHGWEIDWPTLDQGEYLHNFTITNYDTVAYDVIGLAFNETMDWYEDFEEIDFSPRSPLDDTFTLAPGESRSMNIITSNSDFVGGYIYFTYIIDGSQEWLSHPVVGNTKIIVLSNDDFARLVSEGRATKVGNTTTYCIKNQTITNSRGDGIYINNTNVSYVIYNCTICNCAGSGVFIDNSVTGGTVTSCTIHGNQHYGIKVGEVSLDSTDPTAVNLTCNEIYQNYVDGIDLVGFDCTVECNTIRDNAIYGIYVFGDDNKICGNNTIRDNEGYGIKLYNSSGNYIYQNDLIDNNNGSVQAYDNRANNYWNSATMSNYCYVNTPYNNLIGNYWNDHTTPDTDGDGIVDTSYAINGSAGAVDSVPQVVPWRLWGDVDRSGNSNINDGVLVASGPSAYCACPWVAEVDCISPANINDGCLIAGGLSGLELCSICDCCICGPCTCN